MLTKIQKWGNSLGLRIPKSFALEAEVEDGSTVDIAIENGELIIRPVRRLRLRLEDLLAEVTPQNLHKELDSGSAVGQEEW